MPGLSVNRGFIRHALNLLRATPTPITDEESPMTETHTDPNQQPTAEPETDTPGVPVPRRKAALRRQLDAIAVQADADPVIGADDLDAWRRRDAHRRDRSAEIVQRLRDLTEYGELLDNHGPAIRGYLGTVAQTRRDFASIAQSRTFNGDAPPRPRKSLQDWSDALTALGRQLPAGHPDARDFLLREWAAWFAARDGWFIAALQEDERWGHFPSPEREDGGQLPPGVLYGVHLAADPTTQQEVPKRELQRHPADDGRRDPSGLLPADFIDRLDPTAASHRTMRRARY